MYPVGFGPKLGWRLQLHPNFVYASSKGSVESAHMCILAILSDAISTPAHRYGWLH